MTTLDLSNALGGTGSTGGPDMNGLVVFSVGLAVAGFVVLVAIGVSNWRAAQAHKLARQRWSNAHTEPLFREREAKPNPLRKAN